MRQIVLLGNQRGRESCSLDEKTSHYLINVRRMRKGDSFEAVDEAGSRFSCTIVSDDSHAVKLEIKPIRFSRSLVGTPLNKAEEDKAKPSVAPTLHIALVQALPKGHKFDLIIRQAVELEVELIVPLITQHCVEQEPPERAKAKLERRKRIIREAIQQSGSFVYTEILSAADLETLDAALNAKGFNKKDSVRILFHESEKEESQALHLLLSGDKDRVVLAIGPEGGLSQNDCAAFIDLGFALHHARGPVLRVETAAAFAISAVRAIVFERGLWKV
ncbi:MAG TPA: 16S rRNA (uracil(1498)-N(3))-methyltransferase [Rectinema sp.]|nr:16S rRNA (uracil(1498)-N(3))-methyltransferase [Rectinema sp.]HNT59321.1 16S rRNA (uracil(1498)-N(3))-methyltransferase [Rectinema sp.]HNV35610.1 16S rRNA (uracil(1498)-N(3))-methyltransferase [Rectinema sp.]HNZ93656.1 16S rRNA (uracil(1498)-N(3))-methyltransferase [Rectinema sp.]HOC26953.1 16S rRNA (uracil(1498)-N(3))-methyltransferase [Rectinema sp.]